jgi:hypothetical protein
MGLRANGEAAYGIFNTFIQFGNWTTETKENLGLSARWRGALPLAPRDIMAGCGRSVNRALPFWDHDAVCLWRCLN